MTFASSMIVTAPKPGSTSDFNVSVPEALAFIRHTCPASNDAWPWSPHNLIGKEMETIGR